PHVPGERQRNAASARADVRRPGKHDGGTSVSAANDRDIGGPMRRIEALVRSMEACADVAAREAARELVRTVLDLHAAGLARLLELAAQSGEPGGGLVERF